MYQGALAIIQNYLFWNLCNISMFELEIVPHNWMPHDQIDLRVALYNSNLFSIDLWFIAYTVANTLANTITSGY